MWRSEACKTFWLIQHPAAGSGQPENQEFFMGRSSPLSSPTSDMHSWKRWTKLKLICYIRDTSYELGIQVMIANQFLSCFRRVWPDMLISCIEQNQSMKEHEIIELWTPVFGQVLTFKMYMQVFLKSAWKYKSTYWFLRKSMELLFSLQYEKTLLQFLNVSRYWVKVNRDRKNWFLKDMLLAPRVQNSLVICIGTGTNVIPDRKLEQGWVFSRQVLSQRSLNWVDTDMGTETSDSQGWKLRKRHRGSLGFWTLVWDVSSEQRPNYKAEVVVGVYFTRSKCKYKM